MSRPNRYVVARGIGIGVLCWACSAGSALGATLVIQEGLNGYASTVDTYIKQGDPTSTHGGESSVEFDGEDLGGQDFGLLRFDNLFGNGPNQIPPGASITSASLTYNVTNPGNTGTLNASLVDWSESVTFASFGGDSGVQSDEYGPDLGPAPGVSGDNGINVTSSIAAWSANPAANKGWIFRPTGGTDGVAFRSSEDASATQRPKLTVMYALADTVDLAPGQIDTVVGSSAKTVSVLIPAGSNATSAVVVTLTTDDAAVAVPVGAIGGSLDVTFGVGQPIQQNVSLTVGSAGTAALSTTNDAGLNNDAMTINVGAGQVTFSPASVAALTGTTFPLTVKISEGSNDTRAVQVTLTTDDETVAVPAGATGNALDLTFLQGAPTQQTIDLNIGVTGTATITTTNDGGLSDAALPVTVSDGFHFTVTADPRDEVARWNNVLAAMNTNVGGPGAFHVSPGDIDPLQPIRDAIDTHHGASALWYPLVGNHEEETAADMTWIRNEYHTGNGVRTPLKNFTNQDGPATSLETTYTWDYGNAHFIALNEYWNGTSDTGTDGDIVPALYNWLAVDLATNTRPVVFVFGHEPAFPEHRHVGDSLDKYPANRDAFWALLESYDVTAFFVGHTHVYSRTQPTPDSTWQIDVGNAGNDSSDAPDVQTFADVTVTSGSIRYDIWRSTSIGGTTFTLEQSWSVPIGLKIGVQPTDLAHTIERGDSLPNDTFTVTAMGPGTLSYLISDDATWLSVAPSSGDSTGESDTIDVIYDTAGLADGVHHAEITITSADAVNSPKIIPVDVTVLGPSIALSTSAINRNMPMGGSLSADTFTVTNSGGDVLIYDVTDNVPWMEVSPTGGDSSSEADTITVSYPGASGLSAGVHAATITVSSADADNSPQTIAVTITIQGPHIVLSDTVWNRSVFLGDDLAGESFTVTNSGGGVLNYSVADDAAWLEVAPIAGDSSGESDPIDVTYSTATLAVQSYTAHITVSSADADNSPQTLTVHLTVETAGPDLDLDGDVDQTDYGAFQACLTILGEPIVDPVCLLADLDDNGSVDPADFILFMDCLSGPNVPAMQGCDQ